MVDVGVRAPRAGYAARVAWVVALLAGCAYPVDNAPRSRDGGPLADAIEAAVDATSDDVQGTDAMDARGPDVVAVDAGTDVARTDAGDVAIGPDVVTVDVPTDTVVGMDVVSVADGADGADGAGVDVMGMDVAPDGVTIDARADVVGVVDVRPDSAATDARPDVVPADACGGLTMCASGCVNVNNDPNNCGVCGMVCTPPANAMASCSAARCLTSCLPGFGECNSNPADGCEAVFATSPTDCGRCGNACAGGSSCVSGTCTVIGRARQIAPLSMGIVTSQQPTFRWVLPPSADHGRVRVCADRACASVISTFTGTTSAAPPATLPPGVFYWDVTALAGGVAGPTPTTQWQLVVGHRNPAVSSTAGTMFDLNADRHADILAGAPNDGPSGAGRVYYYLGRTGALATTPTGFVEGPAFSSSGYAVADAGDINGDGYSDFAVGAPSGGGGGGSVQVYLGGSSGPVLAPVATLTGTSGGSEQFGFAVAGAGDVNGDGYADLIVGAPGARFARGLGYLYLGSATGISTTADTLLDVPGFAGEHFGFSLSSAGDVNADGYSDFLVGAYGTATDSGAVYAYFGQTGSLTSIGYARFSGTGGSGGEFGYAVAGAGDVDGDGYPDVLVGEPLANRAYVYDGGASGLVTSAPYVLNVPLGSASGFGRSVAGVGDVTGDGFADIVVGAVQLFSPPARAYFYPGSTSGPSSTASVEMFSLRSETDHFALTLGAPGDITGDGYADFLVGADNALGGDGEVNIFIGNPSGPPATPYLVLAAPGVAGGGRFGSGLALRVGARPAPRWTPPRILMPRQVRARTRAFEATHAPSRGSHG